YNTDTLADNIAIIQFNSDQEVKWTNPIAVNRDSWSDMVLSRRYTKKSTNSEFEKSLTESLSASEDKCLGNSGLYAANTKDFVCSYQMTRPLQGSQCNIPYGSVYGIQSNSAAVAGLYSYSVISSSQFCASASTVSYYLLLADYIAFAKDAIGRDVTLAFDQGFVVNNVITYSMSALSFSSPYNTISSDPDSNLNNNQNAGGSSSGFNSTSGDNSGLFADFNTNSEIGSIDGPTEGSDNSPINGVSESEENEDNHGSSETNGVSGEIKDQADNKSSSGKSSLSGGEIAAMVVCLLIGIVLIVSGLFFGSRLYRQYRLRKRWAPDTVQNIVETHAVDSELGNEVEKKFELPSYRHHRRTMLVAAGPTFECACSLLPDGLKPRLVIPNNIINFKGALLFRDGVQTTCELGLISMSAAFISATCLEFISGTSLNRNIDYHVLIDNSSQGTATIVSKILTSDIYVHPNFNPVTWENNIAVVEFNKDTSETYNSYIAMDGFNTTAQAYVQRTTEVSAKSWNIPVVNYRTYDDRGSDSVPCVSSSRLYMTNLDKMTCTSVSAMSIFDRNCRSPFGVMYSEQGSDIVLAAVYSHTIVASKDLCTSGASFYNYYVYLWPYVGFASRVLNKPINIYTGGKQDTYADKTILSMNSPAPTLISGIRVIDGDIYTLQGVSQSSIDFDETTILATTMSNAQDEDLVESDSNPSLTPTPTQSQSQTSEGESIPDGATNSEDSEDFTTPASLSSWDGGSGIDVNNQSENDNKSESSGLSKSQKIIIGVVVPLSVILIGIGALILYNHWKVRREDRAWNPQEQSQQLQIMALDLGGINNTHTSYLASSSVNEKAYNMLGLQHDPK
ncbi:hypothetical protein IWW48_004101, partial [Coemansia sp. RSA 1200]